MWPLHRRSLGRVWLWNWPGSLTWKCSATSPIEVPAVATDGETCFAVATSPHYACSSFSLAQGNLGAGFPAPSPSPINMTLCGEHRTGAVFHQLKPLIPNPLESSAFGFWQEGLLPIRSAWIKISFFLSFKTSGINWHHPPSSPSQDDFTVSPKYIFCSECTVFGFFSCETNKKSTICKIWKPNQF